MTMIRYALLGLICLMSPKLLADALPIAKNLQTLGQQAHKQNIPIAILFSAQGLNSTERLKEEALYPALLSGSFNDRALFTEIQVNDGQTTIDFYGEVTANKEFKALYNLTSLPVIILVNGDGEPLTEPLLSGAYDYYYFYLKQSVNRALKALGHSKLVP